MIQILRTLLATILIVLNFTYPANADAQQKFSFQGSSINNDIKPEQFNFSDVIIKVKSYTKRITFSAKFEDISTPYIANNQQNSFNINIDADPKTGVIYAFRLAADAFAQTIPDHFSYAAKPNNFLIAPMSIQDGKFTSLYNQLTDHDKTMLKGACHYFKNDNNIQTLLSVKAPTGNSIVGQGTNKVSKLLSKPNIPLQIKSIATLCFNATNGTSNTDSSSSTKYKLCNFVKCVDQYSFKKPTYNGDIKPEQFNFSDVTIKARSSTDRVNIEVTFQDVSTPFKSIDKEETVAITFEGDPKSETVYALRLEYGTFLQEIPKEFSYENKANRHLISTRSIDDGSFNTLYEQLTDDDKVKVKGACHHFMDDKSIEKITSLKSPVIKDSKLKFPSSERIDKIILSPNISEQIKALATLCFQATNRVYVKDVQTFLNASGYNVGINDGQWGKKSQSGWEAFLTNQGKPIDTVINTKSVQELVARLNGSLPKLRKMNFRDGFFDTESELKKHTHDRRSLCKYIDCELTLKEKLEARQTINPFMAWRWGHWTLPMEPYQLYWNPGNMPERTNYAINLESINYAFWLPSDTWAYPIYPGIDKYITNRRFSDYDDSGAMYALNLVDPTFPSYITDIMRRRVSRPNIDGVLFDWWVDWQPGGFSRQEVRKARIAIAREVRKQVGDDVIIMANVLWEHDQATVKYLSGAYLEFYKDGNEERLYNTSELKKIERSIDYYNQKLAQPKLIAIDGHRQTKNLTHEDRNTPENRQMAKLLTAMSVVAPDNGYILYGDGANDDPKSDHYHLIYDFYSFDIGKPTGPFIEVASGIRYKEHQKGIIAYNISRKSHKFKRKNGQEHTIQAKSGLFCKYVGAKTECLSNN